MVHHLPSGVGALTQLVHHSLADVGAVHHSLAAVMQLRQERVDSPRGGATPRRKKERVDRRLLGGDREDLQLRQERADRRSLGGDREDYVRTCN